MDNKSTDLFSIVLDKACNFNIHIDGLFFLLFTFLVLLIVLIRRRFFPFLRSYEIDEAEFGIGSQKLKLRPNTTDMQIAYKIWVELSTRKIGLPIDLEHDVISEVYDSWYGFFSVTRDHIKEVPVSRFRRKNTEKIIGLSIDVLNSGIRPHLTRWQARFRRWYERELGKNENADAFPQDIQRKFPDYDGLVEDLQIVNGRLIQYRQKMHDLISG